MLEPTANLCSPTFREIAGLVVSVLGLLILLGRGRGGNRSAILMLALGLFGLSLSFFVGAGALVFGFIDPTSGVYLIALVALRVYVSLPLVVVGAISAAASSIGGKIVAPGAGTEGPRVLAKDLRNVSELKDSLSSASRDLEVARDQIRQQAAEQTRISNKLHETLNLLLSSEEKFRSLFERANDGFVVLEVDGMTIEQVNPSLAEMTGYEPEQLVGRRLADLCGDEVKDLTTDRIRELTVRGGMPPLSIRKKDGSTITVEMSFSVVDVGGSPILLGIVHDVSERLGLLEELEQKNQTLQDSEIELREANLRLREDAEKMRKMNERLRDLQAVKDNFISSVSHEFRTPLTSIRSFSEILLQYDDAEDEVKKEFITIINKESERLTRLVNDVLDLAKIEAGEMHFEMTEVDLNLLVREVSRSLSPLAQANSISVESRLPPDLPPVLGDRDKLTQVLQNLLSNALKFAREGTVVRLEGRVNDENMVEVSVEDRGPGIPKEELKQIFEKFRQVGETLTEKPAGTGLGLAICREIITQHGGRIWVRSLTGEGSIFYFTVRSARRMERPRKKKSIADRVREQMEKEAEPSAGDFGIEPDPRTQSSTAAPPSPLRKRLDAERPPAETPRRSVTAEIGTELPPLGRAEESEGHRRNLPPMLDS